MTRRSVCSAAHLSGFTRSSASSRPHRRYREPQKTSRLGRRDLDRAHGFCGLATTYTLLFSRVWAWELAKRPARPLQPVGSAIFFRQHNALACLRSSCSESRLAARSAISSAARSLKPTAGALRWFLLLCRHCCSFQPFSCCRNRNAALANSTPPALAPASMWNVLRIPTLWWIILSAALLNFNALRVWPLFCTAFLSRVHGLSLAKSGIDTGIVYLLGGVSGGLLSRAISAISSFIAARMAACFAPLSWRSYRYPSPVLEFFNRRGLCTWRWPSSAVTYASLTTYYGLVYSAIQDIVAPNQRASAMAIYFMAMYMCGASFGPLLTGKLSDVLAHRAAALAGSPSVTETFRAVGLQQAMLIIPVLCIALAFVLYMGSRTIIADMAKRESAAHVAYRRRVLAPDRWNASWNPLIKCKSRIYKVQ